MTTDSMLQAGASALPTPEHTEILLDFDGTITRLDVLDELVARFSIDESWRELERQWQAGQIGSRECLSREFALLRITSDQLDAFLEGIELDPGLDCLCQVLAEYRIPVTILSDGIDRFIEQILERLKGFPLPNVLSIRANAIAHRGDRIELLCPHGHPLCESAAAHCKCNSARLTHQTGRHPIYIGDGLSDLCPARKAAVVFAKGRLAEALTREKVAFRPFQTLADVADALHAAWRQPSPKRVHSPCRSQ